MWVTARRDNSGGWPGALVFTQINVIGSPWTVSSSRTARAALRNHKQQLIFWNKIFSHSFHLIFSVLIWLVDYRSRHDRRFHRHWKRCAPQITASIIISSVLCIYGIWLLILSFMHRFHHIKIAPCPILVIRLWPIIADNNIVFCDTAFVNKSCANFCGIFFFSWVRHLFFMASSFTWVHLSSLMFGSY